MKLPNDPLVIITFVLALGGHVTWGIVFFTNSIKRRYAAERDFNHLKNNQKQITDNIAFGFREIDERFDRTDRDLLEIKAYLIGKGIIGKQHEQ
ncbi:hypothetical protein NIES4072_64020 [Nostoc commune NIES-4072]|uniref:Uncharacterized protein n=1 Tax=Nostoc commune NIES-4072 TaxID=2005467 RepID=A0A2R5FVB2_NOSCO|nr:hypothetical protein [Nostoc commune]BBD66329.1 hypothetical protein NIES4070_26940 [Nostoc commune HK-02]GBG22690.1 hypothetical protein NIES4072_64020 [Nostoc commune NIES-4072]